MTTKSIQNSAQALEEHTNSHYIEKRNFELLNNYKISSISPNIEVEKKETASQETQIDSKKISQENGFANNDLSKREFGIFKTHGKIKRTENILPNYFIL